MTQKELLYLEDAICHEENVLKIIDLSLENMQNESFINMFNEQRNIHQTMKNNLMELLEVKQNE